MISLGRLKIAIYSWNFQVELLKLCRIEQKEVCLDYKTKHRYLFNL